MQLTANKWTSHGSFWNLAHRHTLNIMSGMDAVWYKRDPIIPLYVFSSTYFDSSFSASKLVGCIGVFIWIASSILNFFRSSFTYLVWCMYMPSSIWLIWSSRKNFNSPIILIWNYACISLEKSSHREWSTADKCTRSLKYYKTISEYRVSNSRGTCFTW